MTMIPKVSRITGREQLTAVLEAARADNDGIMYPSHVVERGGEIIGAASIANVPLLMLWSHSQRMSARDSMHTKRVYDAVMEEKGHPKYFVACNEHSPYHAHMARFGFTPIWRTHIFVGGVHD